MGGLNPSNMDMDHWSKKSCKSWGGSGNVSTSPFFLPWSSFNTFGVTPFALCSSVFLMTLTAEATAAAQIMSSDGLGGHVCIVSSAAGLISLPGAGKIGPEGQIRNDLPTWSLTVRPWTYMPSQKERIFQASSFRGYAKLQWCIPLRNFIHKIRYPQVSLIYINEEESWIYMNLKKRDLDVFFAKAKKRVFEKCLENLRNKNHGLRMQVVWNIRIWWHAEALK